MERDVKTVELPVSKIKANLYANLTWGEDLELEELMLADQKITGLEEDGKTPIIESSGFASTFKYRKRRMEIIIKSFVKDGKETECNEASLNALHIEDGKFLEKEVGKIADLQKKIQEKTPKS